MKKLLILVAASALFGCNSASGGSGNSNFNVTSITPANNSNISATQSFVATFSNNVNPSTVNNVTLKTSGGVNAPLSCAINSANGIQCTPTTQLSFGTSYTLTFGSGIQNPAGNSLTPVSYNYTTNSNPIITSITPNDYAPLAISGTSFVAIFDSKMNATTFTNANITLNDTTASTTVPMTCGATNESTVTCTPTVNLTSYHNYSLNFSNSVTSAIGTPIISTTYHYFVGDQTYSWSNVYSSSAGTPALQAVGTDIYASIPASNSITYLKYNGSSWNNVISPVQFSNPSFSLIGFVSLQFPSALYFAPTVFSPNGNIFTVFPGYGSFWGGILYYYNSTNSSWNFIQHDVGYFANTSGNNYNIGITGLSNGLVYFTDTFSPNFYVANPNETALAPLPNTETTAPFQQPTNALVNDGTNIYAQFFDNTSTYYVWMYTVSNNTWTDITANLRGITQNNSTYLFTSAGVVYAIDTSKNPSPIYKYDGSSSWVQLTSIAGNATAYYSDGTHIYVGTQQGNLYEYSITYNATTNITPSGSPVIVNIAKNSNGYLYTSTNNAIYQGVPQ